MDSRPDHWGCIVQTLVIVVVFLVGTIGGYLMLMYLLAKP